MTTRRPIVFVLYEEITAPLLRSQVLPLAAALRDRGERVQIAAFAPRSRYFVPGVALAHRRAVHQIHEALGARPIVLTQAGIPRSFGRAGKRLAKALADEGLGGAALICHQPLAALAGCAARDEMRGRGGSAPVALHHLSHLVAEERRLDLEDESNTQALPGLKKREQQACADANAVLCVSRALAAHVRSAYHLPLERTLRLPRLARPLDDAEGARAAARKSLRIAGADLVLAYSGDLRPWETPGAVALLASAVERLQPGTRLLMLTANSAAARAATKAAAVSRPIVKNPRPDDVRRLLAAADYGLLLYDDSVVSRVACPEQFGEYLASGLRPVLTPTIGDQSELCMNSALGVVLPLSDAGAAARRILADARTPFALGTEPRAKRRAWATETISPERTAERLVELLASVTD